MEYMSFRGTRTVQPQTVRPSMCRRAELFALPVEDVDYRLFIFLSLYMGVASAMCQVHVENTSYRVGNRGTQTQKGVYAHSQFTWCRISN